MKKLAKTFILAAIFLTGCQIETKRVQDEDRSILVDPKYSLTQDRSEFEKLRENIPAEKRKANDEKSLISEWMLGFRLGPSEIRERYDSLVRKKRDLFSQDMSRGRENFSRTETKNRDLFLKELEVERTDFLKKNKKTREERADFFNRIDDKRRNYFAEEREKKDEFESVIRDQRKNFEDYLKEKNLDFNSDLKAYSENWSLQKKMHD